MTLEQVVSKIETELPGWWWTTGNCSVSAHATIGPDVAGPDARLLQIKEFDEGFSADLGQPATPAEALLDALEQAKAAKAAQPQ
jgi:hypothetical protein